jgi:hypothetical protein
MDNAKTAFARKCQEMATEIALMDHILEDMVKVWDSRLYGPGGTNAYTDSELAQLEAAGGRMVTADELYSFIIMASQFRNFLHNQAAVQSDYAATLNKVRLDL